MAVFVIHFCPNHKILFPGKGMKNYPAEDIMENEI